MKLYKSGECKTRLKELNLDWAFKDKAIEKEFIFKSFTQAIEFMQTVALVSEEKKHHPEWTNIYNKVRVRLTTNDFGGITDKDFDLAFSMERIYQGNFFKSLNINFR